MAAAFNPTFGDGDGQYCPPERGCKHTDCAEAWQFTCQPCTICGSPMGDKGRYFKSDGPGYEHEKCTYEAAEIERERLAFARASQ